MIEETEEAQDRHSLGLRAKAYGKFRERRMEMTSRSLAKRFGAGFVCAAVLALITGRVASSMAGERLVLQSVEGYEPNRAEPSSLDGQPILVANISQIREHLADIEIIALWGTADGKERNPDALSLRRAEIVRQRMIARGVPAAKLKACGCGSARPVASDETEMGRSQNRRVEFRVDQQGACCK